MNDLITAPVPAMRSAMDMIESALTSVLLAGGEPKMVYAGQNVFDDLDRPDFVNFIIILDTPTDMTLPVKLSTKIGPHLVYITRGPDASLE